MPPLTLQDMSRGSEIDIEKQAVDSTLPTLVLTLPNDRWKVSTNTSQVKDVKGSLPLPSSRFRYTKWHDIEDMEVKGNMLRSPRIRRAPKGYTVSVIHGVDEKTNSGTSIEKWRKLKRISYQNKLECWETCEAVNLSFQELGHSFQFKQFLSVLQKLIRCESLQLMDNGLTDLSSVYLPRCKQLFLQRNHLSNFKKLPKVPMLEHLSLQQNNIASLDGISNLRKTNIISLTLRDNAVELDPCYRKKVFHLIPRLQVLDDIPKLDEDNMTPPAEDTCSIS